jgi:zinc protease
MADVVVRPDFPEAEVRTAPRRAAHRARRARDEARVIAGNAFAALVYGARHPYGRSPHARRPRARSTAKRVVALPRAAYFRPENATLILVGDVDEACTRW